MSSSAVAIPAAVLGVVTHLQLFIHGEWERHAPSIFAVYGLAMAGSLPLALALSSGQLSVYDASALSTIFWIFYFGSLFTSILAYRGLFHPLREYPGPPGAKLTAFWSSKVSVPRFQIHRHVQKQHEVHGDFVRTAPREISILNVSAVRDIYGAGTPCSKGIWYDLNYPDRSLHTTRDRALHAKRRRIWDRGFSPKALAEYEPRILSHCKEVLSQLLAREGKPVRIGRWLDFFGFDAMGDVAFGKSFNMVQTEGQHWVHDMFEGAREVWGVISPVIYLFILLKRMPLARKTLDRWREFCRTQLHERIKTRSDRKDLFTYILGDGTDKTADLSDLPPDLPLEAELAIVAGSETVSTTLTAVVYLIACHPEKLKLLQKEIDERLPSVDSVSHSRLIGAPVLEGCINEALRLYPPVPVGLQRLTPPGGATIAGKWIPGDTLVSVPTYSLHRDLRYFANPNSFIPERWSSQPELIIRRDAFIPFTTGPHICAGRVLAMMELRMLIALLVRQFDFRFSEEHHPNGGEGIFEGGFKAFFVAQCPPFHLVLSKRL